MICSHLTLFKNKKYHWDDSEENIAEKDERKCIAFLDTAVFTFFMNGECGVYTLKRLWKIFAVSTKFRSALQNLEE